MTIPVTCPNMQGMADHPETWGALRCHSLQTLALADALAALDVGGWSPRVPLRRRLPRARSTEVRLVALLPSFVFVPFDHLERALDLGEAGKVPPARAFTFLGQRPALPDEQLVGLRGMESRKRTDRDGFAAFCPGAHVRLLYGPLHGLSAVVINRKGRDHWVVELTGLRRRVLAPSFLLQAISGT
jgi:hypothetical protein